MKSRLENVLQKNQVNFRGVVNFNAATDKLFHFDFTAANSELALIDIADTAKFSNYINQKLLTNNAKYGIGGYGEDRILYKRSNHFNGIENRTIHLGIDIWATAGTEVFVPIGGTVHSFAHNDNLGDYGATIILQHQLETVVFYTLYGHLNLADLSNMQEGKYISRGELLAHFGEPKENGDWPPHLHFQIIDDIRISRGDYPGVCTISESEKYLSNCPNPNLILNMLQY